MTDEIPEEHTNATASDYVEHAREMNAIALTALRPETCDATWVAGKISVGLSLQAAELAGKGILRALGYSLDQIRAQYRNHDLLALFQQAEKAIQARPEGDFVPYHHFLLRTPTINGEPCMTTIGKYLKEHFARGRSAHPRSYFYPDEPTFVAPMPIQGVYEMVERLIEVAEDISELVSPQRYCASKYNRGAFARPTAPRALDN